MLKGFKLSKKDTGGKHKISTANISTPSPTLPNATLSNQGKSISGDYLLHGHDLHASPGSNRQVSKGRNSFNNRDFSNTPDRAVKALHTYHSKGPRELSFNKGDFFYVIGEQGEWFEVANPATEQEGIVLKKYFEVIGKRSSTPGSMLSRNSSVSSGPAKLGSLYAIVLYDFKAEKPDELTAYAGENLFICAHHNYEWFIAKPIGRLGGPGLVPVSFVSIIDIATGYATGNDIVDDINSSNLPTVQEWKANVAKYKASNIALGQIEHNNYDIYGSNHASMVSISSGTDRVVRASVDMFGLENEKYWFGVTCETASGKSRKLKRYYQDFYDLQVQLLDKFPAESGKLRDSSGQWTKRIIPYIPGPVPYVTESITLKRKEDLNVYVQQLIQLPDYISSSNLLEHLFQVRDNGYDLETDTHSAGEYTSPKGAIQSEGSTSVRTSKDTTSSGRMSGNGSNLNAYAEDSTLTGEELKIYDKFSELSISSSKPRSRPPSTLPPPIKPIKIKFYYKDDIFALLLNENVSLEEVREKVAPRVESAHFKFLVGSSDEGQEEITTDGQLVHAIQSRSKIHVQDA